MSLEAIAAWASGSRSYYLYLFQRGSAQYQFTNTKTRTKSVAGVSGTTWEGLAISHGRIVDSDQAARSELQLTAPLSSSIAQASIGTIGLQPMMLTIFRGDANDAETVVIFKGRVLSANPTEEGQCIFACMTEMAALQRKGLASVIQRPCRHAHYGRGCGLTLSDWQVTLPLASISSSGRDLVITGATDELDGFYRLGTLEWGGQFEMMLTHTGNNVTLVNPIPGLVEARDLGPVDVKIAPGCPLSRSVCNSRFDNIENYGGFDFITDNIFDGRQLF